MQLVDLVGAKAQLGAPWTLKGSVHAAGLKIGQGQFHGLRSVLESLGDGPQASRQVMLRGNNLMAPLGALGFTIPDNAPSTQPTSVLCEFSFSCERCFCENDAMI